MCGHSRTSGGRDVGQWMWFGKGVWISAGCVIASCLVQYLKKDSWAEILCFQYFSKSVAWSIVLLGGVEAVWGLRQLYGFSVSGHSLYALTGSFFNPGPYGGYLAMALPVCLHCYLHASKCKKKHIFRQAGIGIAGISGLLVLCVLPATMSRSAWIAATVGCAWVAYMHREKRKWKYLWRKYWRRYLAWGTAGVLVLALAGAGVFLSETRFGIRAPVPVEDCLPCHRRTSLGMPLGIRIRLRGGTGKVFQ